MKNNWALILFCCLLLIAPCGFTKTDIQSINNMPNLLEAAQKINATGVLQIDKQHYVYLTVSNEFITKLYPMLTQQLQPNEKKCLTSVHNKHGAHVTVFYPNQMDEEKIKQLPINSTYAFHVIGVRKIDIKNQFKHVIWFIVQIQSPALQAMIKQINASSDNHFLLHISIAQAKYNADDSCYLSFNRSSTSKTTIE